MNRMVYRIENVAFVIGNIWPRFVGTNCNAVIMCRREFTSQSNVVDAGAGRTEIRGKMQRQMMNG